MIKLIKDANVKARVLMVEGSPCLAIVIDGQFEHVFHYKSRESHYLRVMNINTIENIFSGGHFFFFEDQLVDYRTFDYRGHIHNDDSVNELSEIIGAEDLKAATTYGGHVSPLFASTRQHGKTGVFLGGEWDNFDMTIKELGEGGEFTNRLIYKWSPFSSSVQASFEVERLICLNGMVAQSPLAVFNVPLINDWQENLNIATSQVKVRLNELLSKRFSDMTHSRASVDALFKASDLVSDAASIDDQDGTVRCANISRIITPKVSRIDMSKDTENALRQLEGHISQFDLFNVLTEVSTHIDMADDGRLSIQNQINRLVFDDVMAKSTVRGAVPLSSDSSPSRAFFGEN